MFRNAVRRLDQDFDDITLRINLDTHAPARRGVFQAFVVDLLLIARRKGAVAKRGITKRLRVIFKFMSIAAHDRKVAGQLIANLNQVLCSERQLFQLGQKTTIYQ